MPWHILIMVFCFSAPPSLPIEAISENIQLEGVYVWNRRPDQSSPLRAELTPTGVDQWTIAFFFRFDGQELVYSGTAIGNLENGPFTGRVQNPGKNRIWTFEGRFHDGHFEGTHQERTGGGRKTGTLQLTFNPK